MDKCIEMCDLCKKKVCVVKDHFHDFHIKDKKITPNMLIYRNGKNATLDYHTCDQYHECK